MTDYERIAKAISFIYEHFQEQPDLEQIAKQVYLSPFHFQRLFKDWAGVSPKKFLQYISISHAKKLLEENATLATASYESGLSGTSRLHDLFISIEGMTPGEYKNEGRDLEILYSFTETQFGETLVASTSRGICHLSFVDHKKSALDDLRAKWKNARLLEGRDDIQKKVFRFFENSRTDLEKIKLHVKGTEFQLKVWEALLKIPSGRLSSYASLSAHLQVPSAHRAVGSAIRQNPVGFLIPCHRVIRSTGLVGEYHWGLTRKTAMIGWESALRYGETGISAPAIM